MKPLAELQAKLKEKKAKQAPPPTDEDHEFNPADFDDEHPDYTGGGR